MTAGATWRRTRSLVAVAVVTVLVACDAVTGQSASQTPVAAFVARPALQLSGRVVDAAGILSPAEKATLTALSAQLEHDTKVQFVIATTPSLGGQDIDRYSLTLVNAWGLGDAERDDGLMLLVAPRERKVRIEVGRGMEKILPNPRCHAIITRMVAVIRTGALGRGIVLGAKELDMAVRHPLASTS